jgi:methylthioribose-1-phosphate isomerase
VANPAFDVTLAKYITGIVTEAGVAYPPYDESLRAMVEQARTLHAKRRASRA